MRETYHYEGDLTWAMLVAFIEEALRKHNLAGDVRISYFDFSGLCGGSVTIEITSTDTQHWLTVE